MVFPSVPLYLDHPNWQQQQSHQRGSSVENPHLPPVVPQQVAATGGAGSIRPGSMLDRARMARIPQPEMALKCPRCDSTNTKFCYFNNYSLSQPRHFCKTCRRYWTSGGALRNVPVGGGCRRNKRSKGRNSKSPASADQQPNTASASAIPSTSCAADVTCHMPLQPPQLPFISSLHHHLSDHMGADIGLNFGAIHAANSVTSAGCGTPEMEFQMGGISNGATGTMLSAGICDQWRLPHVQQFPFLTGLETGTALYPFDGEGAEAGYAACGGVSQLRGKPTSSSITQLASVKMEEHQGSNLSRSFMGLSGSDQFWGGGVNAWTDLSGLSSSSTNNLL